MILVKNGFIISVPGVYLEIRITEYSSRKGKLLLDNLQALRIRFTCISVKLRNGHCSAAMCDDAALYDTVQLGAQMSWVFLE